MNDETSLCSSLFLGGFRVMRELKIGIQGNKNRQNGCIAKVATELWRAFVLYGNE